jgi:Ala-tRNA(Pro) deacylase
MTCKERLEAYLRSHQVAYQAQHHAYAFSAQRVAHSEHVSGKQLAKVVIVMADGKLAMLVLPAPARLDLAKAGAVLGAREVRLAHEAEFAAAFPDCDLGAMPPFGNLYGLPVYVDQALAANDTIYFEAGTHTDTMSLAYADFARLVRPTVADLTQRPALLGETHTAGATETAPGA